MGAHEWVDIVGYVFAGATSIVATFLGYRLVRHDQERKSIQDALAGLKQELGEVKGWIAGKYGVKL